MIYLFGRAGVPWEDLRSLLFDRCPTPLCGLRAACDRCPRDFSADMQHPAVRRYDPHGFSRADFSKFEMRV